MKTEAVNKQIFLSSYMRDANSRAKLEGKELFNLLDIPRDTFFSVLKTSGTEYNIFVVVDSIDCYTCFQFHIDNINEFSKNNNISTYTYSYLHSKYLGRSLFKSVNFPFKESYKHKIICNYNMAVLLINNIGKIIYADVADKTDYEKSKIFYHKIKNFVTQ